mgnify:CR=1 FL=1|tara:strand:- start:1507 stop:2202 length:696 start_codon:yes stop_codon:yes gene_type:complete
MLILNGKPLSYDRAFTHENIQYPSSWLRLSSLSEKQAIGISEVANEPSFDQQFYWGPSNPKQLDDKPAVDADGKDLGYTQTGLKTLWSGKQNDIASSTLASSDWRVIKAKETSTDVPADWITYRAAVRTICNTRQAEITSCTTVEQLKELFYGDAQIIKTKEQQKTDADGKGVVDKDGKAVMETVNVTEEKPRLDADGNAVVDKDGQALTDTVNVMIANPGLATAWPTAPA